MLFLTIVCFRHAEYKGDFSLHQSLSVLGQTTMFSKQLETLHNSCSMRICSLYPGLLVYESQDTDYASLGPSLLPMHLTLLKF